MIGVTKIIKRVFVPGFKFKELQRMPRNVGGLKKRAARKRGQKVDDELGQFAKGQIKTFCQETQLIVQKLTEMNIELKSSQVYVSNDDMCAFIDLVGFDTVNKRDVVLEIKRGFNYRECCTKNGLMKFQQSSDVTDCLRNQHEMQALLGHYLYNQPDATCGLVYVDEKSCEFIAKQDFRTSITPEALEAIHQFAKKKQNKRKRSNSIASQD